MLMKKTMLLIMLMTLILSGCTAAPDKTSVAVNGEQSDGISVPAGVNGIPMDEKAAVIADNVVDVFSQPDLKSERVTQALYNQPVSILDEKDGWARVLVVDGSRGWVRTRFLDKNVASIYGRQSDHKIVVTSKEKSVFSNYFGGYTIIDVAMGTEFLSFNDYADDSYEVYLPGNKTGWLRGSGIIHIDLNSKVPVTKKEDFVATAMKFKGTSYLLNGVSSMGMDSPGLVYISARINGVDLSRNLGGQYLAGTRIAIEEAREGDLVFLAPGENAKEPVCVGICIGNGSYIYAGKLTGFVTISGLNEKNPEGEIIAVKRLFAK